MERLRHCMIDPWKLLAIATLASHGSQNEDKTLLQLTVKLELSFWHMHIVLSFCCSWVNQLHIWIQIITWLFIIKEHV